jgi:hypothetical protein
LIIEELLKCQENLVISFNKGAILRQRMSIKITEEACRCYLYLRFEQRMIISDEMLKRCKFIFLNILHKSDYLDTTREDVIIANDDSGWKDRMVSGKREIFDSLIYAKNLYASHDVYDADSDDCIDMATKNAISLYSILTDDNVFQEFYLCWSKYYTVSNLLSTLLLCSRVVLADSVYWREFPREIVEKIVCLGHDML